MKTKVIFFLAMIFAMSLNVIAQNVTPKFGIELNGGASFATSKLAGAELKTGIGFEGTFHYNFIPELGIYAGWGWNKNKSDLSFAGSDCDFEETGYVFGLQYNRPFGESAVNWYVRAGGLYNHIEVENKEGDIIADTGHGIGWQLAGGLQVDLGKNWSLTPGLKFNSLSRDVDFEGINHEMNLNYLSVRVGILKKF